MKKIIALILSLVMLLSLCSCSKSETGNEETKTETENETEVEGALTLKVLNQLQTKEELAELLGVDSSEDVKQAVAYLRNFYNHLPGENDKSDAGDASWSKTHDGYNSLTIAQAKSFIKPVVLTTENWKEYIEPQIKTIHYFSYDEEGNEIEGERDEACVSVKPGYYFSTGDSVLRIVYDKTGEQFDFDGDYWPFLLSFEDDKYYVEIEDGTDENGEAIINKVEFNMDDYSCIYADAVAYEYNLDSNLKYIDYFDEETCEYKYLTKEEADKAEIEFDEELCATFIQYGESNENEDLCLVGYKSLGSYIYTDEDFYVYKTESSETIDINPAEKLTLDVFKTAQTKEDIASILGVCTPDEMTQMIIYLDNLYYHLPSENDQTEPSGTWGKTAEGYNYITPADAKCFVTPIVVTTENWKDYLVPYMQDVYCYSYDDDGNEIMEINQEPEIGIDSKVYSYPWNMMEVVLKNNKTDKILKYTVTSGWPEEVSTDEDGNFRVTVYDENGYGTNEVFDINNYTCLLINCVLYKVDVDPALLYHQDYDETLEDWVTLPLNEYDGEDDNPIIFVQYGETEDDIGTVSIQGLGEYAYIEN